jgi:hypothetical protein
MGVKTNEKPEGKERTIDEPTRERINPDPNWRENL